MPFKFSRRIASIPYLPIFVFIPLNKFYSYLGLHCSVLEFHVSALILTEIKFAKGTAEEDNLRKRRLWQSLLETNGFPADILSESSDESASFSEQIKRENVVFSRGDPSLPCVSGNVGFECTQPIA